MKNRLIFWAIYIFAIVFMYLSYFPDTLKKSEVKIQHSTVELITHFEGLRHTPYYDSRGNLTIGIGHLIKKDEHHLKSAYLPPGKALHLLRLDLEPCEQFLLSDLGVPLTQNQFDALASLCHNIGVDNLARSEVVQHLKNKDYKKAANAILNWNKPAELTNRRKRERSLFLNDV